MARKSRKISRLDKIINSINRLDTTKLFETVFALAFAGIFAFMFLGLTILFFTGAH